MGLSSVKKEFDDLTRKVTKLESLRHQLDMIDTNNFAVEAQLLRSRLHNVDELPEAVKEFQQLKEKVRKRKLLREALKLKPDGHLKEHDGRNTSARSHHPKHVTSLAASVPRLRDQIHLLKKKLRERATLAKVKFGSGVGFLVNTTYKDFTVAVKAEINRKVKEKERLLDEQLRQKDKMLSSGLQSKDVEVNRRLRAGFHEQQKRFAEKYRYLLHQFNELYRKKVHTQLQRDVRQKFEDELHRRLEHEKRKTIERLVGENAQKLSEQKKSVVENLHRFYVQKEGRLAARLARKEASLNKAFAEKHVLLDKEMQSIRKRELRLAQRKVHMDEQLSASRAALEQELTQLQNNERQAISSAKAVAYAEIANHKKKLEKRFAARKLLLQKRSESFAHKERFLAEREKQLYQQLAQKRSELYHEVTIFKSNHQKALSLKLERLKRKLGKKASNLFSEKVMLEKRKRDLAVISLRMESQLKRAREQLGNKEQQLELSNMRRAAWAKHEHDKMSREMEVIKAHEHQHRVEQRRLKAKLRKSWKRLLVRREELKTKISGTSEHWKRMRAREVKLIDQLRAERTKVGEEIKKLRDTKDAVQAAAHAELEKREKAIEAQEQSLRESFASEREAFRKKVAQHMHNKLAFLRRDIEAQHHALTEKENALGRTFDQKRSVLHKKLKEIALAEEKRKEHAEQYKLLLHERKKQLDKEFEARALLLKKKEEELLDREKHLVLHLAQERKSLHEHFNTAKTCERKHIAVRLAVKQKALKHHLNKLKRKERFLLHQEKKRKASTEKERAQLQKRFEQLRERERAQLEREEASLQAALAEEKEKIKEHGWELEASLREEKAKVTRLRQLMKARFVRQRIKVQDKVAALQRKEKGLLSAHERKQKTIGREVAALRQRMERVRDKAQKYVALTKERARDAIERHRVELDYLFKQRTAELKSELHRELMQKLQDMQSKHKEQTEHVVKRKAIQLRKRLEKVYVLRLHKKIEQKDAELERQKHELEQHIIEHAKKIFG